ncbi:MAG: alanine racemase, partial [Planctomycetota bacterium]|nr:alanine racemase [Planctomycetota bacterium]
MGMDDLAHPSLHRSWVEIDLGAVRTNVRRFREAAGSGVIIMPAIKANAYGHGAEAVARAALSGGADRFAVATCLEGMELREAGVGVPIQVLGASFPEEVRPAIRLDLILSVHELSLARLIAVEAARVGKIVPTHLKIDTGMGRLGILPENAASAARELASYPGLFIEGAFMHFADAGDPDYSRVQLKRFRQALGDLADAGKPELIRHAANTTAALLHPESRLDLIRPGAGIYGYADPAGIAQEAGLESVMAWRSSVIQVKEYPSGSHLGYNRTFTTSRPSRVAILPTGYADGYRREFSNQAQIII